MSALSRTPRKALGRCLLLLAAVLLCCLAAACRDGDAGRFHVSGTLTFNGEPVPAGMIYFSPDESKKNSGPQGYAEIREGAYDTRRTGKGGPAGPVHVHIEGFDGQPVGDFPFGKPLFFHDVDAELPRASVIKDFEVPTSAAKNVPKQKSPPT